MKAADEWSFTNAPRLFANDFTAWLRSLSPKARHGEPTMHWADLGAFTISAYGLQVGLIGSYEYMAHRNNLPRARPADCTPEGFYLKAVETRRQQIGLHDPFTPTPYERLSPFSHFLYRRMAGRIAEAAGFYDDGLGDDLDDDGLGDGLNGAARADDGLGGSEGLDDLDDGLGGLDFNLDDGLGDGL